MTYEEYRRGIMFFEAKDYAEAGRILAPIAEREPGNQALLETLGRAYFHSAQLGRAEAAFRDLVELAPDHGWAHEALARTLERRNRPDEARRHRNLARAMRAPVTGESELSVTAANLA